MKWEYIGITTNHGYISGSAKNLDEIKSEIEKVWKDVQVKREGDYLLSTSLNQTLLFDILGSKEWELTSTYVEKNILVRLIFKRPTSK